MVMSLKPLKKSDLGKDWVKNDRYDRKIGINPEYHLIVTEGTDTEPNYFEEIRRIINEKYSDRIVLKVEGNSALNYGFFFILDFIKPIFIEKSIGPS